MNDSISVNPLTNRSARFVIRNHKNYRKAETEARSALNSPYYVTPRT